MAPSGRRGFLWLQDVMNTASSWTADGSLIPMPGNPLPMISVALTRYSWSNKKGLPRKNLAVSLPLDAPALLPSYPIGREQTHPQMFCALRVHRQGPKG